MTSKIEKIITIGLIAGVGLLAFKNKDALTTIGTKVSTGVSAGLNKLAGSDVKAASKE